MKIAICGGGPVDFLLDPTMHYIGVDHGLDTLLKQGIQPVFVVGDLDSVETKDNLKNLKTQILPQRKDITDSQAAIEYALKEGYDEIDVFGVTGGRLDHFMAMIALLQSYSGKKIHIKDKQNDICILLAGKHGFKQEQFDYFSFFALEDTIISLSNCAYPLDHYHLKKEDPLCVSNQWIKGNAYVEVNKNILFIRSRNESM